MVCVLNWRIPRCCKHHLYSVPLALMRSSDHICLWRKLRNVISKLAALNFITLDEGENELERTISSLYHVDRTGYLVYFFPTLWFLSKEAPNIFIKLRRIFYFVTFWIFNLLCELDWNCSEMQEIQRNKTPWLVSLEVSLVIIISNGYHTYPYSYYRWFYTVCAEALQTGSTNNFLMRH